MNTKVLQLTLAIIKPDVIKQPHILSAIRDKIIEANFKIVRSKSLCLSLQDAEKFYEEHRNKFFYNRLTTFMSSGLSDFYILARLNAIDEWRKIMGPTKVYKAQFDAPNSIRGLYGLSDTRNATHGSDSPESAAREIKFFFPHFDLNIWYKNDEYLYRNNRVAFLKDKFVHIPITK